MFSSCGFSRFRLALLCSIVEYGRNVHSPTERSKCNEPASGRLDVRIIKRVDPDVQTAEVGMSGYEIRTLRIESQWKDKNDVSISSYDFDIACMTCVSACFEDDDVFRWVTGSGAFPPSAFDQSSPLLQGGVKTVCLHA